MAIIKPEFVIEVDYYKGFAVQVYKGMPFLASVTKGAGDVFYTEPIKKLKEWKDGEPIFDSRVRSLCFLAGSSVPEAIGNLAKAHNILKQLNKKA